jgi:hypothetical protein
VLAALGARFRGHDGKEGVGTKRQIRTTRSLGTHSEQTRGTDDGAVGLCGGYLGLSERQRAGEQADLEKSSRVKYEFPTHLGNPLRTRRNACWPVFPGLQANQRV